MTKRSTIDILMPFYGDVAYFRLAVESVLAQLDPQWRLVIVDDLYPDLAPGKWVQSLGDARITYQRNQTNLGVSGNFAKCVDLANADYTVIMGCDDVLLPGFVTRIRQLTAKYPEASFVQPGVSVIDAHGVAGIPLADRVKKFYRPSTPTSTLMRGEAYALSVLKGNWTYFPSIAWRTDVIKSIQFRSDLEVVLDLALQLDIVGRGGSVVVDVPDPVYAYRRHSGSVSAWTAGDGTRFEEESAFFREASTTMRSLGWLHASRAARVRLSSRLNEIVSVPRALRGGGPRAAIKLAKHAVLSR